MAGYFLYSLDGPAFTTLVTDPTDAHARPFAEDLLAESGDDVGEVGWPADADGLTAFIRTRLASPDWYSDLDEDAARLWNDVVFQFTEEPGEACGLDMRCADYESIYWDCAEFAAANGAPMLAEPQFGSRGFRCPPERLGDPADGGLDPYYSLYTPDETRTLLAQLEAVEPHAAALPDRDEEGSVAEQFFEGLLPPVADAAAEGRAMFVQLDT